MESMKIKFAVVFLVVGLLAACAGPATDQPVSPPTEEPAAATEAPATLPAAATNTSAPPTTEAAATELPAAGATVSFATDILPLIESRCINCHGGDRTEEGLSMRTHAEIMTGSENGPVVTPGDADNSLMAELVLEQKMPKRGPKLTPPQVQLIIDWINQGALDN
ncbi:MAG TPA: c-type cytochrome domain-containing protein [Anaerolineales bacterium]|nr:c-type cytochrome domain-containing protein [Anaerolineales bacterium]